MESEFKEVLTMGDVLGLVDGPVLGDLLELFDGAVLGLDDGAVLGDMLGLLEGDFDGELVDGCVFGDTLGLFDGEDVDWGVRK